MLLACNQATGDSATRSFGPAVPKSIDHPLNTLEEAISVPVAGTDRFEYEGFKSPDDIRENFASITIQTTPEEAQEVINAIRTHPDGDYTTMWNNCTTTCSKLLRMIGKTSSHALTPYDFFMSLYRQSINDPWAPQYQFSNGYDYGKPRPGYDAFQMFFWLMGSKDKSSVTTTETVTLPDGTKQSY